MTRVKLFVFLFAVFTISHIYAQTIDNQVQVIDGKSYIIHEVQKGETIFSICKKFEIDQNELEKNNPSLVSGLKLGSTLKIPTKEKPTVKPVFKSSNNNFKIHIVKKKETVYSISNLYNISNDDIFLYNPNAENGIKENDTLKIVNNVIENKPNEPEKEDASFQYHTVLPGESSFGLAKKYSTTIAEIEKYNPGVTDKLNAGMIIKIPISKAVEPLKSETTPKDTETKKNNDKLYTIEKGDTFFSLKRKFGVSKEELISLNPELANGPKVGFTIKLPTNNKTKAYTSPSTTLTNQKQHIVGKGQTLFSIAQLYNVDANELKNLNPSLKDGKVKSGQVLIIPSNTKPTEKDTTPVVELVVVKKEPIAEPTKIEPKKDTKTIITRRETFKITMFLPLFYFKNISMNQEELSTKDIKTLDSLRSIDPSILEKYYNIEFNATTNQNDTVLANNVVSSYERSLFKETRKYLEFYEGALLAIDSLEKMGANIELTLYDTELDAKKVDALMRDPKLVNSHLIIGPVEVSMQRNLAAFCHKNQIPMVSPFSDDNTLVSGNPFYFQIYPNKDYLMRKTADYVVDNYKGANIVVLKHWGSDKVNEALIVEQVRQKMAGSANIRNIEYSAAGAAGANQIQAGLKTGVENVILMAVSENKDEREAFLSRAINNLNTLSKDYKISLIGMNDYPRLKSINTEYYHQVNLHFLSPNYIDYTTSTINNFIKKYRKQFAGEPTLFSYRGYDIVWFFTKAFDIHGRNFVDKISSCETPLLISDFDFRRVGELGGFMNKTVYIINFTPDFDVQAKAKYTNNKLIKLATE